MKCLVRLYLFFCHAVHGCGSYSTFRCGGIQHTHLSEHSVGKLAYFLHMLSTNVQLAAADTQQGPVRQLLSVQLHLDEIIFSGMWVLDSHLQNKFWEMEKGREKKKKNIHFNILCYNSYRATEIPVLYKSNVLPNTYPARLQGRCW